MIGTGGATGVRTDQKTLEEAAEKLKKEEKERLEN